MSRFILSFMCALVICSIGLLPTIAQSQPKTQAQYPCKACGKVFCCYDSWEAHKCSGKKLGKK